MSFFDEAEEPPTEPRSARRTRRPSGSGRRPPFSRQTIQIRRAVAALGILIVLILVALGVHSCQVSARNSALKDYNNRVSSLIQGSDQTGRQLFSELTAGAGSGGSTGLQNSINETRLTANRQLSQAERLNVPDEMKPAHQNLLLALQMRRDAIGNIAYKIQPALGTSTNTDAINAIAAEMARFYASDVVYKDYTTPHISGALKAAGISGETINSGQFLPDIQWLTPAYVAGQLHVSLPSSSSSTGKPAPGIHGHKMDSVSVSGTTLQTSSTNTIPASPPPTFTCMFTNDGQNNETNVVVKVSVSGTSISGQAIVPQTTTGQQATAQVTLSSSPPAGTYTVTAMVERVPGEAALTHNTLSFPVAFQ